MDGDNTEAGGGVQATPPGRGVQATQAGRGVQATQAGRGVQATQAGGSVRAWRYWQVSPRGLLRSVSQRHVEWPPGRAMHAACVGGGHPAPSATCSCGFSGARDLETLKRWGLCLSLGPLVVGEVDLGGRLVPEPYGFRGEYAQPASLGLVTETVDDDVERSLVLQGLTVYGVPVTTVALEDAVAGDSAATLAFQVMAARASRTREA